CMRAYFSKSRAFSDLITAARLLSPRPKVTIFLLFALLAGSPRMVSLMVVMPSPRTNHLLPSACALSPSHFAGGALGRMPNGSAGTKPSGSPDRSVLAHGPGAQWSRQS